MTDTFLDLKNQEIQVGYTVAAAIMVYRSAQLRTGKVLELIPMTHKVRIEWENTKFYGKDRAISLIEGYRAQAFSGIVDANNREVMVDTKNIKMNSLLVIKRA